MAIVLSILQGIHKTDGIFPFSFLDGLEKLIGQMGEIFSFAEPDVISLRMKLHGKAGKFINGRFLWHLPILGYIKNPLEGFVECSF